MLMINFFDSSYSDLPEKIMIFGPPGTGKTSILEHIFHIFLAEKNYVDGVYITYSKSLAAEARERIGMDKSKIATFHSLFSHYLGWQKDEYMDDNDYTEFCNKYGLTKKVDVEDIDFMEPIVMDDLSYFLANYNFLYMSYDEPQKYLDVAFNRMLSENKVLFDFSYIFEEYEIFKQKKGKKDYTDILVEISRNPDLLPYLSFLEVDEVQDLRPLMWKIIDKWSEKAEKIILAGDDDQNLYFYDNADVRLMLKHRNDSTVYHLSKSFRLPKKIHSIASSLIKNVKTREQKEFYPTDTDGEVKYFNDVFSAFSYLDQLNGSKFILARTSYLIEKIAQTLTDAGIPFMTINPRHYYFSPYTYSDFDYANIFISYPPNNIEEMRKIIRHLPASLLLRGVKTAMEKREYDKLPRTLDTFNNGSYFLSLFKKEIPKMELLSYLDIPNSKKEIIHKLINKNRKVDPSEVIRLDTIHAAKGKEADHVLFINNTTRKVFESTYTDQDLFDAEIRIKYVGLTRAKKTLIIVSDPTLSPFSFAI